MLIVLDLDETLIHASVTNLSYPAHFELGPYQVYKRPFLQDFLLEIGAHFEVAVWSSAHELYVAKVVEEIFPAEMDLAFVWAGSKCTVRRDFATDEYVSVKKLKKLKQLGYPLEQIIMVDDSPEKMQDNYGNGVVVRPFYGDPKDTELPRLSKYLLALKAAENVRKIEKRNW